MTTATAIDEGPILFTGPLVVKILEDYKTETRRVVDPKLWPIIEEIERVNGRGLHWQCADFDLKCRYDHEQLWLRETWAAKRAFGVPEVARTRPRDLDHSEEIIYRATDPWATKLPVNLKSAWRPSIHMPRWASRIDLRVKEILLQRLQDMRPEDALAEGIEMYGSSTSAPFNAMDDFKRLWDKINGHRPGCAWQDNPFVWCIRFERLQRE